MIAPIQHSTTRRKASARKLHKAHHFVASTLLGSEAASNRRAPGVPAWQAWTFVLWLVIVSICYIGAMLNWF